MFYRVAVMSWGIAPSEFWNMTVREWWLCYDQMAGTASRTPPDYARLYERAYGRPLNG